LRGVRSGRGRLLERTLCVFLFQTIGPWPRIMCTPDSRISLVMITFNRRDEVLRSLSSLSELPERPQIVVVDNGSADNTAEAIAERYPAVRLIRSASNLGAAARNLGVECVDTPYVAFADDDVVWEPGSLSHAADLFDAQPNLGLAVARVLVGRKNQEDPICRVLEQSPLPRVQGMPGPSLLGFLAGACAVRRSAFQAAGGFPSWIVLGGEEELLAADLAALGWWICYVPQLVVHHYPSSVRDSRTRRIYQLRNGLCFAWLRRPLGLAIRQTLAMGLAGLCDRSARQALAMALGRLPLLLRERRVLPAEVERCLVLLERRESRAKALVAQGAPV